MDELTVSRTRTANNQSFRLEKLGDVPEDGFNKTPISRERAPPMVGMDATTAPLRRQMEQSQRLGLTIPSGRLSSKTTEPQWQLSRCWGRMTVSPTWCIPISS